MIEQLLLASIAGVMHWEEFPPKPAPRAPTLDAVKTTEKNKEVKTVVITTVIFYCEFSLTFLRT
jgi:hypothetical protein